MSGKRANKRKTELVELQVLSNPDGIIIRFPKHKEPGTFYGNYCYMKIMGKIERGIYNPKHSNKKK